MAMLENNEKVEVRASFSSSEGIAPKKNETVDPSPVGVEEGFCFAHGFKGHRRIRSQMDSLAVQGLIDAVLSFHDASHGPSW